MPAPDPDAGPAGKPSGSSSTATLSARLTAVERALDTPATANTGDDRDDPTTDLDDRLCAVEDDLATLSDRLAEVEAATQAVRGYVGSIRATNERVRRRADRALAATEALRGGDAPDGREVASDVEAPSSSSLSAARDTPRLGDDPEFVDRADPNGGASVDGDESEERRPFVDRLGDVL